MSVPGGLLVSAFGGLLVIAGFRRLTTAISVYQSDAIPLRRISTTDGPVEFQGRAEPLVDEGAVEAPFSGEEALYCEVWMETEGQHRTDAEGLDVGGVQKPERQRNTRQTWLLAEHDEIKRSFAVEDGGTRVELDPVGGEFDVTGHMGTTALTVEPEDSLPEEVRDRLETLDETTGEFDGALDTWDPGDDSTKYREARLEPGDPVHVTGGVLESVPDEWGTGVTATVGAPEGNAQFRISKGTESSVVRNNVVQFVTGVGVGLILLGFGLQTAGFLTIL
ncbi:hypothetical protein [Natrinema halophilum]|uniref:Uncharacterized protein n=1 Tax=Natrinema halophilum TaxID=1699371 RepID=A0A7D5KRV1_9EURY|nr:hypothetical protein [Natrinema halophilum]QLG48824.1 hypothetical protein HYG82_08170 [Natrinema halophilum]